ncbi:MAG: T9SS type A sorting domain-containing protein [Bacteroidia bacterium]|nr:T9SS type A sorting domain-containing protein [Bacteroidia bacterium]
MNRCIRFLVIFLLCIGGSYSHAQFIYWNKLYNNHSQWDLSFAVVNLGGYYLTAGNTADLLATDFSYYGAIWLFYVDSVGNKGTENIIRFKNRQAYKGNQHILNRTFDHNFIYYGGLGDSNNNYSTVLIKLDSFLQPIWQTIDTGQGFMEPLELIQLSDSGFMVSGFGAVNYQVKKDGFITRYNKNGDRLWTKYYGDARQDFLCSIVPSDNNTFLLSGTTDDSPFLMKIDSGGNLIWRRNFNIPNTGLYIKKSIYGEGYIAYGSRNADTYKDYYGIVARINENAEFIWKDSIRLGTHVSAFCDAIELPGGNIIAVGLTDDGGKYYPNFAGWIAKFFKEGGVIQERIFGDVMESWLFTISLTDDNGLVGAGYGRNNYDTMPRGQDSWVIKLDTNLCDTPNCWPGVGVKKTMQENTFTFYPNPFSNEFTVEYTLPTQADAISIKVTSMQGMLIKEIPLGKTANGKLNLKFDNIASGMYYIQLLQNGVIVQTQKLIKQR